MHRVRQTGHARDVRVPVIKPIQKQAKKKQRPTERTNEHQSRIEKTSKNKKKERTNEQKKKRTQFVSLLSSSSPAATWRQRAAVTSTGRKRKYELVAGGHRLPHVNPAILPLALALHRIERCNVCRISVRCWRRTVRRRMLVRGIHRRCGAHVRRVRMLLLRVWLMSVRVRRWREPRVGGLVHVSHGPSRELVAVSRQVRIREALGSRREDVRRRGWLPKRV